MDEPLRSKDAPREHFSKEALELIKFIAAHLVDEPEKVQTSFYHGEQTTVLTLKVSKADVGKIIGKQGKMADALRTILKSLAAKEGFRAVLEIEE